MVSQIIKITIDRPIQHYQPLYYHYWGKAKADPGEVPDYHLLPYHCLDVAAVGFYLMSPDTERCKAIAPQLEVSPEWLRDFFVFCLALHDLGKFARAFQGLQTDLSDNLVKPDSRMVYDRRHDSLGFWLWIRELSNSQIALFTGENSESKTISKQMEPWLEIVTGHHGQPPIKDVKRLANYFLPEDIDAAKAFIQDFFELLLPKFDFQPLTDKTLKKRLQAVSWQLAGIAVLADWLGSNQDYFPYCSQVKSLADYWHNEAIENAQIAMSAMPKQPVNQPFGGIKQLFSFIEQPTPLQSYASSVELNDTPQLFILEDVTGAGKTEAALILTQRLMEKGLAKGLYVALPTMATANAMYERLGKVYRKLYVADNNPSLILAHGARDLSAQFRQSVWLFEQQQTDKDYFIAKKQDDQESSATAYCNAWLADSRKKALLADVGVGTLDQALLAVLPARHQSLRLLGLSGKVLLVDEVHAYDSYMQKLLDALLEAHARQGGSAILLSATLPRNMRTELVNAFHRGLGEEPPNLAEFKQYPLATQTPAPANTETAVDTRDEVKRTVQIERLNSEDEVIKKIEQSVNKGQCVCWLRNTVKAARKSYQELAGRGQENRQLLLFHSRFAMCDRQQIESQVLKMFGKHSTAESRKGRVLIATQVVEQSLDLDFDVLITDLAPIDLIIQRAGRLQRHVRDSSGNPLQQEDAKEQRGQAVLTIVAPEPGNDAEADWLKKEHAGTQAVYPHVGQLWLTLSKLMENKQFTMPDDARELIEYVYSGEKIYPEALDEASWSAEGEQSSKKSLADMNALKLSKGYTYASGDWDEETRIPTRLTEQETVSVALAIEKQGQLLPYAGNAQNAWALSTLSIPQREWEKARQAIPDTLKQTIEQMKEEQKALRWLEVFPLTAGTRNFYNLNEGFLGDIPTNVGNK